MMQRIAVPVLVVALLAGLAAVVLLLRDDDGGEPALVAAPSATMAPPATPTPPWPGGPATPTPGTLPTLSPTEGTLVYLLDNDLWVAKLNIPGSGRQITFDSVRVAFAGHVRREDGGVDLYVVSQLTQEPLATGTYEAELGFFRVPLEGGEPQELFRYTRELSRWFSSSLEAAISPDGRHVLYPDYDGLVLRDLTTQTFNHVLTNGPCTAVTVDCWNYGRPEWSPRGDVVKVVKGLYESAVAVLLRPFESPPGVVELMDGGYNGQVSPDDGRYCYLEGQFAFTGRLVVLNLSDGERHAAEVSVVSRANGERALSNEPYAYDCVRSADGRIAAAMLEAEVGGNLKWLVFLGNDFGLIAESPAIPSLLTLVAWLPDDSGVLYNRFRSPPGVFMLEDGLFQLPFEADVALAVIP